MKIKMTAIFLTLGFVFITGVNIYADSFRSWILQSTHIILATGLDSDSYELANDYEITSDRYRLTAVKSIYGDLKAGYVGFTSIGCIDLSYDEPIYVIDGSTQKIEPKVHMVFLEKRESTYYLLGLIGSVSDEDILFIESKIREIREIQQMQDTLARFTKTIDWIIQCATNQQTRGALEDLFSFSNFISYYERIGIVSNRKDLLNAEQKKLLLHELLKQELNWTDLYITDLLYDAYPAEITQAIISSLKNLPAGDYYFGDNLMGQLIELQPSSTLKNILKNYKSESAENNRQKRLIRDFIKEYEKLEKTKK